MSSGETTTLPMEVQRVMKPKIPGIVKRNVGLLALSVAFVGSGTQLVPTLGPLMVVQLTGMVSLVGLGNSLASASRFMIAYPLGKIMDAYGRRIGLMSGLALGLVGALVIGISPLLNSFPVFVVGMLAFGMGMAAGQQIRLAAADMFPPSRRAEGLGYVLSGSVVGALCAPLLVFASERASQILGVAPTVTTWFFVPVVIVPAILFVALIRPDPKDIAADLDRYYPGYDEGARATGVVVYEPVEQRYPRLVAYIASSATTGLMVMVMALTTLTLDHFGHGLTAISVSVAIHVVGMFGFSWPLGRLTDSFGRRNVLLLGLLASALGSVLVPASPSYWVITAGTFLVGVGWSCVNVASTALIADTTGPTARGRAMGLSDTFASAAGVALGMLGGPMVEFLGLGSLGAAGIAIALAPFAIAFRLRETKPGRYLAA